MTDTFRDDASRLDVRYVAHLARLHLSDEEAAVFQPQLEQVLGYVRELGALDVEGVEPTAHAFPVQNVFRDDEVRPGLDHEAAMKNAPQERQGQFIVPKIIE
ncbi:MAG TPA: Asp-tRNA(Asn)/Glu-tRNA(Gln) amidotransferase subunit GatC [Kiritimatiellia bacterium]|nr:Asp-tRNA(Asn)/Glu-tRNA(Gln) amidotransferase subunit GatC [Kiritimatiellia bacterium]HRZ13241.1 Asp-tRNA(Asn)/Glu-tRNA(Gln) amidotransferase subunit GatC [Kiritimatiellia bacterium]HSA18690.1 Asp-tRNA(Asn)/Glu-tRNA(Gln) amidotransferase subunit GatC [Kiritimatiellia bacterium]